MKEILKEIGLSEKESILYMAGLGSIRPTALLLAKKTGIKRSSIYDILGSLSQKGLIAKAIENNYSYFKFLPPEELLAYLERNRRDLENDFKRKKRLIENNLVQLKSLENIHSTKPKVKFFEGNLGMREAYEDTLNSKEEILAYANVVTMHEGLPHFFPEYYKRRQEENIFIKAIIPDNKMNLERRKEDEFELRDTVLVDSEKYEFSPEINLYDNKVLIVSWKEKMAISIESKEIADCFKKMHSLLWSHLKKEE